MIPDWGVRWRWRFGMAAAMLLAVLVGAWIKVPGFQESAKIVWTDILKGDRSP